MTRKLVMLEHLSLDGFLAGPHGEMDWIRGVSDEEMWDYVHPLTAAADADLELVSTRTFSCGVVGLHYTSPAG